MRAVEIVGDRIAGLSPRGDEGGVERAVAFARRDAQRAIGPVQRPAAMVPLQLAEIGEDVIPAPPGKAGLRPAIVIARMAPRIDHAVDRRAAAQPLAARPPQAPVVEVRFGRGPEAPIVLALRLDQFADAGRHADEQVSIVATGFDQQHADCGVFGQARRHDAAGRAAPYDDIVEALVCHALSSCAAVSTVASVGVQRSAISSSINAGRSRSGAWTLPSPSVISA
ncbi:hypothetical protein WR25_04967 [Diploscapter pachys]|uniref:Uncharacterized protein n=1 Tax=Diploscapter pachys TaxID=2018661 RepID=A0A2A2KIU7_9BILA|nr:hypothetical protein WR25_04967 [Diploscapter pachys]